MNNRLSNYAHAHSLVERYDNGFYYSLYCCLRGRPRMGCLQLQQSCHTPELQGLHAPMLRLPFSAMHPCAIWNLRNNKIIVFIIIIPCLRLCLERKLHCLSYCLDFCYARDANGTLYKPRNDKKKKSTP